MPTSLNDSWKLAGFDDVNWVQGTTGVGCDTGDDFTHYIGLEVDPRLNEDAASVFI